MTDIQALIAELKRIASQGAVEEIPPPNLGSDELKLSSYQAFLQRNPWWPDFYRECLATGKDPSEEYFKIVFKDHTCRACSKRGHSHHPDCRCKRLCFP